MKPGLSVLVIDDEAVVARSCERILSGEGVEVVSVDRGQAGLEALEARPFDAVLLDLKMPGIGGLDVVTLIRERRPDLPVLVMTGYGTMTTRLESIVRGASGWIEKPFGPEELLEVLRAALGPLDDETANA